MKKSKRSFWLLMLLAVMCMALAGCGGSDDSEPAEETEPSTEVEVEAPEPQDFTTTDGKFTLTLTPATGAWEELEEYVNPESTMELYNYSEGNSLFIISQDKYSSGYALGSYNDEILSMMSSGTESYALQSTEDVTAGGYQAKKNIFTYVSDGINCYACAMCIETDNDFIQLYIEGFDSNSEKINAYVTQVMESFKVN